ncbi:MAG: 1-phosphofructokinase family hexose kinase [Syntrophorhabdales bacterium]|jgi:1-phosphofructokinase family hexose kinase
MIYTVTLNPSLDRIIDIDELIYDDVNQILEEKRQVSGKAIDVARVIGGLGGHSCLLGLVGGYNGFEVEGRLINEGIVCDLGKLSGETRTNIIIHQTRKKLQTLFSASEPQVTPAELAAFYNKLCEIPRDSYVVISGSVPPGISENFYAQIITSLAGKNVRIILDADGEALRRGVKAKPFLIKPNIHEFGRLVEKNVRDVDEIIEKVDPYLAFVRYIVVSMGARGVVAVSQTERYQVVPPKVNVKSSIGAGDALIGGLVYALSEGSSFADALTLGVACGTASTLNAAGVFCSGDDVENIRKEVLVKNI